MGELAANIGEFIILVVFAIVAVALVALVVIGIVFVIFAGIEVYNTIFESDTPEGTKDDATR